MSKYWLCPVCSYPMGVDDKPIPEGKVGCPNWRICTREPNVNGLMYRQQESLREAASIGIAEIAKDDNDAPQT